MGVKTGNTLPYSQDNLVAETSVAQNGEKIKDRGCFLI